MRRKSRFSVLILLTALFAAVSVFGRADAATAAPAPVYTISRSLLLNDSPAIFPVDDSRFLLLSSNEEQTVVCSLNAENGSVQPAASLNRRCTAWNFCRDALWIACSETAFSKQDNSLHDSTLIARYDYASGTLRKFVADDIYVQGPLDLAVDKNENLYMINCQNRAQVKVYSPGGKCLSVRESSGGPLTSLAANPSGTLLYASYMQSDGFNAFSPDDPEHPAAQGSRAPALPYTFADDTCILDAQGAVYSLRENEAALEPRYCAPSDFRAAAGGKMLTGSADGKLLLSDIVTGESAGQFTLHSGNLLGLQMTNRYVLALSRNTDGYAAEVFSTEHPEALTPTVFTPADGVFSANPAGECPASSLQVDTPWKVEWEPSRLSAGRGKLRAVITNGETGTSYARTEGDGLTRQDGVIFFCPPDELPDLRLAANHYTVQIENLYTPQGLPAVLRYELCLAVQQPTRPQAALQAAFTELRTALSPALRRGLRPRILKKALPATAP